MVTYRRQISLSLGKVAGSWGRTGLYDESKGVLTGAGIHRSICFTRRRGCMDVILGSSKKMLFGISNHCLFLSFIVWLVYPKSVETLSRQVLLLTPSCTRKLIATDRFVWAFHMQEDCRLCCLTGLKFADMYKYLPLSKVRRDYHSCWVSLNNSPWAALIILTNNTSTA